MTLRTVVFSSPWCRLVSEPQRGEPYFLLEVPDYVAVVARTGDARIVFVQQHRPAVGCDTIELPSGLVDSDERPEDAARRELLEETGMVADRLELIGTLAPDVGRLVNRMWCYFAADVTPARSWTSERGITPLTVPEAEALSMAADGRILHALHVAVFFLALRKRCLNP
ncbi:MAG: NUDIX hydrolase [Alphaproteobacteria bacterium]|nr:NUDIX hydrolase [Alphaproteobacteria bacterium]MBM3820409.1 NUDIX hydrolase [Acidimicrobiia bacterium]